MDYNLDLVEFNLYIISEAFYMNSKSINLKKFGLVLLLIVISLIVASIGWTKLSYKSFYDGVAKEKRSEAMLCSAAVESILLLDSLENQKKLHLASIFKNVRSEIKIVHVDSGKTLYEKENPRKGYLEEIFYSKSYKTISGEYLFTYIYSNRPEWKIGLLRAATFSLYDYANEEKNFAEWWYNFRSFRLWERSVNFYIIFISIFFFLLAMFWVLINYSAKKEMQRQLEIERSNLEIAESKVAYANMQALAQEERALLEEEKAQSAELQLQIQKEKAQAIELQLKYEKEKAHAVELKLEIQKIENARVRTENESIKIRTELNSLEMFRQMYKKMFGDFEKQAIIDTKQDLQKMEFEWQPMMEKLIKDIIHKDKNEWVQVGLEGIDKKIYEEIIIPFKEQVLNNLKKLPEIIDIKLMEYTLGQVIDSLEQAVPLTFARDKGLTYAFNYSEIKDNQRSMCCSTNLSRLNSIVFNLLANANQATIRKKDAMREKGLSYNRMVRLNVEIVERIETSYFCISVCDNGGGFEDEKLNSIYKIPVISSDKSSGERLGEGTMYIAFFVKYMCGEIEAKNYEIKEGFIGAETSILLPII